MLESLWAEDSHEARSIAELKCLRGFPDREASKPESKIYRFPTDLRKQLASPHVIILSKILGLRALQIEIFSVLQF